MSYGAAAMRPKIPMQKKEGCKCKGIAALNPLCKCVKSGH